MAVRKSSHIVDTRELLDQTPPDYVEDNYYLKYNQYKVDADWDYRPNKKWVDIEEEFGSEKYRPEEVVIQGVRTETGNYISDDWHRLVFRNCFNTEKIGSRYRFSTEPNRTVPSQNRNIWIALNCNNLEPTSSVVVRRCNGRIGSIYIDEDGEAHYHYEPIIQVTEDSSDFWAYYNKTVMDIRGKFEIIAQYNKYTAQYFVNQRFIVGINDIYKVNNIIKSDSRSTNDPTDLGIIKIYLDEDQLSDLDDVEHRMAYNGKLPEPKRPRRDEDQKFIIEDPKQWTNIIPDEGLDMRLGVYRDGTREVGAEYSIEARFKEIVEGDLFTVDDYIAIENNGDGSFHITRLKQSMNRIIELVCRGNGIEMIREVSLRPF